MSELTPITREEMYLDEIADALENGGGGGGAAVYNATITIQKNGTKVDDFTANQRTDKTINITVPTSATDVSALPDTTKYAAALSLTINSSTYVMTGQLKDQNGDNLGTAQTIDLPLESVVVGGSYNSQTKKVVLTLQNGNTIEFSVADLVSGLQTELSASNKLNPAYINYDSTHAAVSDTEKSTWNGKQSALTTEQLTAVNSGITSADVAQITTNKNNISLVANQSVNYNVFDIANTNVTPSAGATAVKTNNTITVTSISGNAYAHGEIYIQNFKAGTYYFSCKVDSLIGQDEKHILVRETIPTGNLLLNLIVSATGTIYGEFTVSSDIALFIGVYSCYTSNSDDEISISDIAIIPKSVWDAGFTNYQPYALSNAELTTKEKQNENNISLIKQVPTVSSGDNGKVLTAGTNGEYSWVTASGGGGTSDYTQLTNLPQINSTTLTGNKSLSDLGIAAAADIPSVPITEIQKNSTTISPVSGVVNITVPTTAADVSALPASTKYAGASTAGGSATSAAKLDTTSAGSTTQPVYFANGVPTATTYSLAKSVPADAVFTDTTYSTVGSWNTTGLVKNGSTVTSSTGYTACPIITGIPYYKDTTYESKSAASGGTAVSLCTTGEKYTWNNKSTLQLTNSTTPIVDGTAAIGTSTYAAKADHVHPTDTSRQAAITAQSPLSADVVSDTNTTHKFATQTQLDQISTNANNILTIEKSQGQKNIVNIADSSGTTWIDITVSLSAGNYALYFGNITTNATGTTCQIATLDGGTIKQYFRIERGDNVSIPFVLTDSITTIRLYAGEDYAGSNGKDISYTDIMICDKAYYDGDMMNYQPYSMTLSDITAWIIAHS